MGPATECSGRERGDVGLALEDLGVPRGLEGASVSGILPEVCGQTFCWSPEHNHEEPYPLIMFDILTSFFPDRLHSPSPVMEIQPQICFVFLKWHAWLSLSKAELVQILFCPWVPAQVSTIQIFPNPTMTKKGWGKSPVLLILQPMWWSVCLLPMYRWMRILPGLLAYDAGP